MAIKAEYQNSVKSVHKKTLESQSVIEIRFSDMGEITSLSTQVWQSSLEISSGRVNYGGRVVLSVAYVGDSGAICRMQKGGEFAHFIDDEILVPSMSGQCSLKVKKTTLRREGSICIVSVVISSEISIFAREERKVITSLDGAFVKTEKVNFYDNIPFSGEIELEDEFDCVAGDILITQAKPIVISSTARGGFVEIEGEIYLNILAVRDNQPISFDRIIPFKAETTCEESDSGSTSTAFAEIKDLSIDAKVVEEKESCDAFLTATLSIYGCLSKMQEVEIITDAFSASNELECAFIEENFLKGADIKVYSERVSGQCSVKAKVDYTCAFKACVLPEVDFSPTEQGIGGAITATLIFEQNGELVSSEITLPFEVALSGTVAEKSEICVAVSGISIRQREEGECECQALLKICSKSMESVCVRYPIEVNEGKKIDGETAAISVCMPEKDATIFEIGKRLKVSPDEILKTNPDLKFPLSDDDRIIIYRTKQP